MAYSYTVEISMHTARFHTNAAKLDICILVIDKTQLSNMKNAVQTAYPAILGQSLMYQDLLHSITCCWVINLGVDADLAGHVNVAVWVNVDVADAVGMAQHRNLGVLLDVSHQGVAASGDDQVNDIIELQQFVNICPRCDQTDEVSANLQQKTDSK